jgi:hypothetical protein
MPGEETDTETTAETGETDTTDETDTGPGMGCGDDINEAGELCFERIDVVENQSSAAVALGDFDDDGVLDLLVGQSDGAIALLGNDDGTFDAPIQLAVSGGTLGVAAGDLDGDGQDDAIVTSPSEDTVVVFISQGNGFANGQPTGVGSTPRGLAVGDFGSTSALDVATANEGSGNVTVAFGNGTGALQNAMDFQAGSVPLWVSGADIDDDSETDLLVADVGSDTAVLLLQQNGTFPNPSSFGVGSEPRGVAVADFDEDDALDLAVPNQGSNDVSVLLGDGAGDFANEVAFNVGDTPRALVVGEFDADGVVDIAVANRGDDRVGVLVGDGTANFAGQVAFAVTPGPIALAAGDVNSDGVDDIVSASAGAAGGVTLLLSDH